MRAAFLTLVLAPVFAFAQSWCPPGATWTYNAGLHYAGFNRMTYTGDTIIDGFSAQIIDRYSAIQLPQPPPGPTYGGPPWINYIPVAVITRSQNDVIYTWEQGSWDTLYWFAAAPGQGWTAGHVEDVQGCTPFVVADTGTAVIDGVALRWIEIESWYRVYERIGSTWDMFMYCPNWIIDGPTGMRCYSDEEMSYQVVTGACEQFVGLNDPTSRAHMDIYPNPGSDHFILDQTTGQHTITLFDAKGRTVVEHPSTVERTVIDTSRLPSGTYLIRLADREGRTEQRIWIKS